MRKIECFKCKHQWIPRKPFIKRCPRCKRTININMAESLKTETCSFCGHSWVSRKDIIYRCPKCQKFYMRRIERAFNMLI